MASSEVKAKPESDVTPVGEDTLDFDDVTLKGKKSRHLLVRLNVGKTFSPRMIANGKWYTVVFRFCRTLGFPNLPISRTKTCFLLICFTQAL